MQPEKIFSLMALLAVGARALPLHSKGSFPSPKKPRCAGLTYQRLLANSLTVRDGAEKAWKRESADPDFAYQGTYAGGAEKRADAAKALKREGADPDFAYQGTYAGGAEKRADAAEA